MGKPRDKEFTDQVKKLWLSGMPLRQIEETLATSYGTIYNIVHQLGLPTRKGRKAQGFKSRELSKEINPYYNQAKDA